MRWCTVQTNEYDLQAKCIRICALIINCTIIMKTNSRFSRNVYAISDRIWCNKHLRHTTTEKYDNNGKGGYFRFDDDNNISYRYRHQAWCVVWYCSDRHLEISCYLEHYVWKYIDDDVIHCVGNALRRQSNKPVAVKFGHNWHFLFHQWM